MCYKPINPDDVVLLQQLFIKLNPNCSSVFINSIYKKYTSVTLKGKVYRSSGHRNSTPRIVWALWNEQYYGPPPTTLPDVNLHPKFNERPVCVHYYASFTCTSRSVVLVDNSESENENQQEWTLAHVSWLYPHPKRYKLGKPAELWCSIDLTEPHGMCSYLPFSHILSRCAYAPFSLDDDSMFVVVPL